MDYIIWKLDVIDFSNQMFLWDSYDMSTETIEKFSDALGEFRTRDVERGPPETYLVSGPEKIVTFKQLRFGSNYVDPIECRRLAEKFYTTEMHFPPRRKLMFVKIADMFSFGSIMNGVVIY